MFSACMMHGVVRALVFTVHPGTYCHNHNHNDNHGYDHNNNHCHYNNNADLNTAAKYMRLSLCMLEATTLMQ